VPRKNYVLITLTDTIPDGKIKTDMYTRTGKISTFGGASDQGVAPKETLALYTSILARSLSQPIFNPCYCAMRWDYAAIAKALETTRGLAVEALRHFNILVSANGKTVECCPCDWGPSADTGRLIDCGPHVLELLGVETDDIVSVTLPDACALKD